MSAAAILFALQALPVCWTDRAWGGKGAQLAWIAEAIDRVSANVRDPRQRAAELATIGYWESRYCRRVQLRRRGPGHGFWQLELFMGRVDGDEGGAVLLGAWNAGLHLDRAAQCGRFPEERFTAYAGRPCADASYGWPTSHAREQTYYWIKGKIDVYETRLEASGTDEGSAE